MKGLLLLRLALAFTQKRQCDYVKLQSIEFEANSCSMLFDNQWWLEQGLLQADLLKEAEYFKEHGIELRVRNERNIAVCDLN